MIATAYVINLAASTRRWHDMGPVLAAMGITDPIRFDAIDGAALDAEAKAALQRSGRLCGDADAFDQACAAGELGCALSHAAVLADIVAREVPSALILEDDIALAGDPRTWRKRHDDAFADLPAGWELWYLYRCFDIEHRIERLSPRTVIPWTPQGGAAYAVSLAGARKLLAALTPLRSAVDRVYAEVVKRREITAFATSPMLVAPGAHPSIINRDNAAKKWVIDGINHPPEYWPEMYLAHLGETLPAQQPKRRRLAWWSTR